MKTFDMTLKSILGTFFSSVTFISKRPVFPFLCSWDFLALMASPLCVPVIVLDEYGSLFLKIFLLLILNTIQSSQELSSQSQPLRGFLEATW